MIISIVTTYKPDGGLRSRLEPLLAACDAVIIVDNTPGGATFDLPERFHVIHNMANLGIGKALNNGLVEARRLGATELLFFDQDSTPSEDFARDMVASLREVIARKGPRSGLGPTHVDDETGTVQAPSRWLGEHAGERLQAVTCLPTSGITVSAGALSGDDLFAEDLFLDLADFEWCWRLRTSGWTFYRDSSIQMPHRHGLGERQWMGLLFHVPAPYRHYFQFRDTLRILSRSYVPIYAKLRLAGLLPLKMLVYPFILDRGGERFGWMLKGVRDALCGVRGVGAASERLSR